MNTHEEKIFWRPLGLIAMIVGLGALTYSVYEGLSNQNEPLIFIFVILVGGPAIVPAVFGYFMYKGKVWAAWALRVSILSTLLIGAVLDILGNLDIFSFPMFSIPFILGCVAWLVASFAQTSSKTPNQSIEGGG